MSKPGGLVPIIERRRRAARPIFVAMLVAAIVAAAVVPQLVEPPRSDHGTKVYKASWDSLHLAECNWTQIDALMKHYPPAATRAGRWQRIACNMLAGRFEVARDLLRALDPMLRAGFQYYVWVDVVYPPADAPSGWLAVIDEFGSDIALADTHRLLTEPLAEPWPSGGGRFGPDARVEQLRRFLVLYKRHDHYREIAIERLAALTQRPR